MKTLIRNLSTGKYCLDSITIKEICNKYPDKVTGNIMNKHGVTHLVMDTCTIIFNSKFNKVSSDARINKQIRNNNHN